MAADVVRAPRPHRGRGGWTWYTGSAGWMYRVGLEAILGLQAARRAASRSTRASRRVAGLLGRVARRRLASTEIDGREPGAPLPRRRRASSSTARRSTRAAIPLVDDGATHRVRGRARRAGSREPPARLAGGGGSAARAVDVQAVVERLEADRRGPRPPSSCRPRSPRAWPGSGGAPPRRARSRPSRSGSSPSSPARRGAGASRPMCSSARMKARCTTFFSSRTLPGQLWLRRRFRARAREVAWRCRCSLLSWPRKCSASSSMSSRRSRSGGRLIGNTFRR